MKILMVIPIIFFCNIAFADTYAVEKKDGSIEIVHYFENSIDSLDDSLASLGLSNLKKTKINPSELPPRADRKYWKMLDDQVVIDVAKKDVDLNIASQKQSDEDTILSKLKISEAEAKILNEI